MQCVGSCMDWLPVHSYLQNPSLVSNKQELPVFVMCTDLISSFNQSVHQVLSLFCTRDYQCAHSMLLSDARLCCSLRWSPAGAPLLHTCPGHVGHGFWLGYLCWSEEPRHSLCYPLGHVILECLSQIMCSGFKGERSQANW